MFNMSAVNSQEEKKCKLYFHHMFRLRHNSNHRFPKQQTLQRMGGSQNNSGVNRKIILLTRHFFCSNFANFFL